MLADQQQPQQQTSLSMQESVVTIPVWPYGPGGQPMESIPEEEDFTSPTSSYSLCTDAQQSVSPGSATANTTTTSSVHRAQKSCPSPKDSSATTTTIISTRTSMGKPNSPVTDNSLSSHQDGDVLPVRTVESKHRVKEIYTTEEVDTLVSTLPKESVPEEWNRYSSQEVVVDPSMAHTYITELSGNGHPASARGSKYSYTYESHIDDQPLPASSSSVQYISNGEGRQTSFSPEPHSHTNGYTTSPAADGAQQLMEKNNLQRHSTSTQKVTRVTKITTTRSVKQIPVNPDDIFFDADGNPIVNGYDAHQLAELEGEDGLGIDLSRTYISEREEFSSPPCSSSAPPPPAQLGGLHRDYDIVGTYSELVPSAPGVPQVIDISATNVSLAWLRPDRDGTGGEILGYRVQFRRNSEFEPWEPAHDDLLGETECKITNLEPQDSYHFRVVAANSAGFGPPSESSAPIQLRYSPATPSATVNGGFGGSAPDYSIPYNGTNADYLNAPSPPTRPIVVDIDGDRAIVEWRHIDAHSPLSDLLTPIIGYMVEYRAAGTSTWMPSNDYPVPGFRHQVQNLRPNGEYEFRVLTKDEEGRLSAPSLSSGLVRIRPAVPARSQNLYNPALQPPGQPQALDSDSSWIRLQWSPGAGDEMDNLSLPPPIGYLLERREIGDPDWVILSPHQDGQPFIVDNQFIVENLHPDASYEFRVSTIALKDGSQSAPSDPSDVIRLRPPINYNTTASNLKRVPERPSPPEYLDFDGGSSVTLCWLPAQSVLPVLGYEVAFRDVMQDATRWYKLTEQLVRSCKTTVGYLIHGHQYQFRILAKNSAGFSPPSDASPLITIGQPLVNSLKDTKYVEAERHATVALLQDEMIRESPPLPDRDDSPPPIYRQPAGSHLHWRDPTLKEVIDYLKSPDQAVVQDASGYLQHLTFNNDAMKEETRNYGGIPNLIQLLKTPEQNPEILRNACGCLKNLAFGKENDVNKKLINQSGGVKALAVVIQRTQNAHVKEEATGALWNISSCDDLKEAILNQVTEPVINGVVIPFSGLFSNQIQEPTSSKNSNVFRNGTGILRNISAISANARKTLRAAPHLIDALIHFLGVAIEKNQLDNRSVENCICLLRNLSYRVQEVVEPKYDPHRSSNRHSQSFNTPRSERSKSAPSGSPKSKSKKLFKKSKKDPMVQPISNPIPNGKSLGAARLWHPETVKIYLRVLQESADPEILEASAAAIQNLAACQFDGSVLVRAVVRTEKGLPILVELLRLKDDKVVCAVVTALRNLALDERNLELIGKYAMKELVSKLPKPDQMERNPQVSDATIGAVLGILWEVVRQSLDLTRTLHETLQGTERLRTLTKCYPAYGKRVCKYASQVLYMMWQHKELHDTFRKSGLKESDFYSGTLPRGGKKTVGGGGHDAATNTLARPISSQGAERTSRLQQPLDTTLKLLDESGDSAGRYAHSLGTPNSGGIGSYGPSPPTSAGLVNGNGSSRAESNYQQVNKPYNNSMARNQPQIALSEPLYASVHKRNGNGGQVVAAPHSGRVTSSVGGDSWV